MEMNLLQKTYDKLNVPDLAVSCDVLSFKYKIKNNELSAKAVGFQRKKHLPRVILKNIK